MNIRNLKTIIRALTAGLLISSTSVWADLNLADGNENPLFLFGVYDDLYKKVDGEWLIDRTRIDFLWPTRHITDAR